MSRGGLSQTERQVPMTELIESAIMEDMTSIGDLSGQDVSDIWWRVSQSIANNYVDKKGTRVPELGTFTMIEKKTTGPSGKPKSKFTPTFVLAATFCARHDIHTRVRYATGSVPVVSLGLARIAAMSGFDKSVVESCIKEVVYALEDRVDEEQASEGIGLELAGIGRLTIKRNKAKFRFFSQFEEQPRVLFGRPPSAWSLSSRCQTAGYMRRSGDTSAERPSTASLPRGTTPMLLPSPSYKDRESPFDDDAKRAIAWQSQMGFEGYLPIVDPEEGPASVVRDGAGMSPPKRNTELPPLTQTEVEEIAHHSVRNMNLSTAGPEPQEGEDTPEKAVQWDRATGRPLARLEGTQPDHKRLNATYTMSPEETLKRTVNKQPRAERTLFDPHKIKANPNPNKYVVFQQSQALPDPEYHARQAATQALEDSYLAELQTKRAAKSQSIEVKMVKAQREANKRTASFNWNTHAERPKSAVDTKARMDLMNTRPATSHGLLRDRKVAVAGEVAMQMNSTRLQHEAAADMNRQIEEEVLAHARSEFEREQAEERARAAAEREEYRANLDTQVKQMRDTLLRTTKEENDAWAASRPFKQAVLDEESDARSRQRKLDDSAINIQLEDMKFERSQEARAQEVAAGREMIRRAKETLTEELKEGARQMQRTQDTLRNEYSHADRAKKHRDARSAQERKAGAKIGILEQTDQYDNFALPADGANFFGRATNLASGTFVKGAAIA